LFFQIIFWQPWALAALKVLVLLSNRTKEEVVFSDHILAGLRSAALKVLVPQPNQGAGGCFQIIFWQALSPLQH
jgi:hypothetical protein